MGHGILNFSTIKITWIAFAIQGLCNNITGPDRVYVREVMVHPELV